MSPSRFLSTFLLALASLQAASAVPLDARTDYPEVIPGPGLPSLESLGLTSAQLYEMPAPVAPVHPFKVMYTASCGPSNAAYTNVNGIIACYQYLNNLGTTNCGVGSGAAIARMCQSGDAVIASQGLAGATSSYCRDVASAVLWTINSCTRSDQSCAGSQAAAGNGNLIVGAYSQKWV